MGSAVVGRDERPRSSASGYGLGRGLLIREKGEARGYGFSHTLRFQLPEWKCTNAKL